MADSATLGARLSAARAITTTQTSGAASAASTAPKADATPLGTNSPESTAPSTAAATGADATPASTQSSTEPPEKQGEPSGDAETPKTTAELKKNSVRLDRRERKLRRERKEWTAQTKEKEAEFAKARQELIAESSRISNLQRHAEQRFGWAARGETAWKNDDKVSFAKAIEKMAGGASLAAITQWLAGATDKPQASAQSQPSEEEQAWRREKAEHDRKVAEERARAEGLKKEVASAEKREQAKKNFASAFTKHPFLANPDDASKPDPDALQEAFGAFAEAMKHRSVGETAREVAKRTLDGLHARELRRIKRLGLEPKATGAAPAAKPAAGKKEGERLPEPPPTNRNGKPPSLDETRANRIAAAKRLTEQQRRGVVQ